jgi:hypothetical protein
MPIWTCTPGLADGCACLLRPARKGEPAGPAAGSSSRSARSSNPSTTPSRVQLDLERHGRHTPAGVLVRILQRILALTAATWHNDHTGHPVKRSLLAYDH